MAAPLAIDPNPFIVTRPTDPVISISVQLTNTSASLLLFGVRDLDSFRQVSPLCGALRPSQSSAVRVVLREGPLECALLRVAYSLVPLATPAARVGALMEGQPAWRDSATCVIRGPTHEEETVSSLRASWQRKRRRPADAPPPAAAEEQQLRLLERARAEKRAEAGLLRDRLGAMRRELAHAQRRLGGLQEQTGMAPAAAACALLLLLLAITKRVFFT